MANSNLSRIVYQSLVRTKTRQSFKRSFRFPICRNFKWTRKKEILYGARYNFDYRLQTRFVKNMIDREFLHNRPI